MKVIKLIIFTLWFLLFPFELHAHGGLNALEGVGKVIGLIINYFILIPLVFYISAEFFAYIFNKSSKVLDELSVFKKYFFLLSIVFSFPWLSGPELDFHTIILVSSSIVFSVLLIHQIPKRTLKYAVGSSYSIFLLLMLLTNPTVITFNNYVMTSIEPFDNKLFISAVTDPRFVFDTKNKKFVQLSDGRILFNEHYYTNFDKKNSKESFPVIATNNNDCRTRCVTTKEKSYPYKEIINCKGNCILLTKKITKIVNKPTAYYEFQKTDNFPRNKYKVKPTALINIPLFDKPLNTIEKQPFARFKLVKDKSGNTVYNPIDMLLYSHICENTKYDYSLEELLLKGANPNFKPDSDPKTAMSCAVLQAKDELIINLIKHGGDVNYRLSPEVNLLYIVTTRIYDITSRIRILKLLIKHGADINSRDNDGETVLHSIVYFIGDDLDNNKKTFKTLKTLLDLNVDANIRNNNNNRAYDSVVLRYRRHLEWIKSFNSEALVIREKIKIDAYKEIIAMLLVHSNKNK